MFFHLQTAEREHRRSTGKPCLDGSGNLYQYDNYDEVAMDTDSEAGSPSKGSPVSLLSSLESASKLCTVVTFQWRHRRTPSCMPTTLGVSVSRWDWYVSAMTLLGLEPPRWTFLTLSFLSTRTSPTHFCPRFLPPLRLSRLHRTFWRLLPNLPLLMRKKRRRCC